MRYLCLLVFAGLLGACGADTQSPKTPEPAPKPLDQSFREQRPSPLPAVNVPHPEPQLMQLGNGLSLWVLERESPTLSLRLVCRVGSRDNPRGSAGLAAITNRMLTEGTKGKTALQLAVAAENLGTSLAESSGRDSSSVELEVLPEHEDAALQLLAEVVQEPAFRKEDFERVRAEWLDDLIVQRQDPTRLAWLIGYRALLGSELGIRSQGTPPSIRSLKLQEIQKFHAQLWTPDRCAVLAAGPTSTSTVEGIASEYFGGWPPGRSRFPRPPDGVSPPGRSTTYVYDRPGAVQTAIFVAGASPKRYSDGHEARQVLNNLLGGLFTSRLNTNLREEHGYTYGAFSSLVTTLDWGLWAVSTSVRTDVTAPALSEIDTELDRLVTPQNIQQQEIERARTDLAFQTSADLAHTTSLIDELEDLFVYELQTDYFSTYSERVRGIGAAEVDEQLRHVPRQARVVVLVGDQRKFASMGLLDEHTRSIGLQWIDGEK